MLGHHFISRYSSPDIHYFPICMQTSSNLETGRTSKFCHLIPLLNPHHNILDTWSFHFCLNISSIIKFQMSQDNEQVNRYSSHWF